MSINLSQDDVNYLSLNPIRSSFLLHIKALLASILLPYKQNARVFKLKLNFVTYDLEIRLKLQTINYSSEFFQTFAKPI